MGKRKAHARHVAKAFLVATTWPEYDRARVLLDRLPLDAQEPIVDIAIDTWQRLGGR